MQSSPLAAYADAVLEAWDAQPAAPMVVDADGVHSAASVRGLVMQAREDVRCGRGGEVFDAPVSTPEGRSILAVRAHQSVRTVAALLAAWSAGATPLLLPPRTPTPLKTAFLARAVRHLDDCPGPAWRLTLGTLGGRRQVVVSHRPSRIDLDRVRVVGLDCDGFAAEPLPLHSPLPVEWVYWRLSVGRPIVLLPARVLPSAEVFPSVSWLHVVPDLAAIWKRRTRAQRTAGAPVTVVSTSQRLDPARAGQLADRTGASDLLDYYGSFLYDGALRRVRQHGDGADGADGADGTFVPLAGARFQMRDAGAVVGVIEGRSTQQGNSNHPLGAPCDPESWQSVGDTGSVNDGMLRVLQTEHSGRAMVNGYKLPAEDIVAAAEAVPGVNGATLGYAHGRGGRRETALYVSMEGPPISEYTFRAALAERLLPHEVPRNVLMVGG